MYKFFLICLRPRLVAAEGSEPRFMKEGDEEEEGEEEESSEEEEELSPEEQGKHTHHFISSHLLFLVC